MFNVSLNSEVVKEDLDIFREVGGATAYVIEQQNFEVTDWSLEVSFAENIENPKVKAVGLFVFVPKLALNACSLDLCRNRSMR